jgi:hypothetical protein
MRPISLNLPIRAADRPATWRAAALLLASALVAATFVAIPATTPAAATTCTDSGQGASYGGGTGESGSPYEIATVAHLEALRDRVNSGQSQSGCHFQQTADLDLGAIDPWVSIGDLEARPFSGTYDGGYRRIDRLTITGSLPSGVPPGVHRREGLFGYVQNGTLRNFRLYGVNINLTMNVGTSDDLYVGALVANPESTSASGGIAQGVTRVETSSVEGSITVDYTGRGSVYVGGIVGRSQRGALVDDRLVFRGTITGAVESNRTNPDPDTERFNFGGLVGRTSSDSKLSLGYASAVMNVTVRPKPVGAGPRPVYVGLLTGSSSSRASELSELYAVGSISVTNPTSETVYSGAIGFLEHVADSFTDIYHLDTIVGGTTASGTFTANPTYTFAGGQVTGFPDAGAGGGVFNVLARTDAQMRLAQPATTMTGTGGRWIYNNHPTTPDVNGKWFLVLAPAAGEYPYPVFFWEIDDVPLASRVPFTLFRAPEPVVASGTTSGPTLVCVPSDPPVGSTVTCEVTGGAPDIDILWRAAAGERAFASTGVRLGSDGTGTFSFVVPRSALGLRIDVELVEWTRPLDVGVAGGPVPTGVAAGEGMPVSPAIVLLVGVLGLAAVVSGLLAPRSRRTY